MPAAPRFVTKILHIIWLFVRAFMIIFLILGGLILYLVLMEVPLNFLNGFVEDKVFHNKATIDNIHLKWDYVIKKPVVVLEGLKYDDQEAKIAFNFQSLGVSFDVKSILFKHKVYPIYVYVSGLKAFVTLGLNNGLTFSAPGYFPTSRKRTTRQNKSSNPLSSAKDKLFTKLLKAGLVSTLEKYKRQYEFLAMLDNVAILSSSIDVAVATIKQDFTINLDRISIHLNKKKHTLELVDTGGVVSGKKSLTSPIKFSGGAQLDRFNKIEFNERFIDVVPQTVLDLLRSYQPHLSQVTLQDLRSSIYTSGVYDLASHNYNAQAHVKSESGSIVAPGLAAPLHINGLNVKVSYKKDSKVLHVGLLQVKLDKNAPIRLNKYPNSTIPLHELVTSMNFNYEQQWLQFFNTIVNLAGHNIAANGIYNPRKLTLKLTNVSSIGMPAIATMWPIEVAPKVREWLVTNIKQGSIDTLVTNLSLGFDQGHTKLLRADANADVSELMIDYLHGLPIAYAPKAHLTYNRSSGLNITYDKAVLGSINSPQGVIKLNGGALDESKKPLLLQLDLNLKSTVSSALSYLNSEPLHLLKAASFDFNKLSGNLQGNLALNYNFGNHRVQNLNVDVVGNEVKVTDIFKNKDVEHASLNLNVKDDHLSIYGRGEYAAIPANFYVNVNWNKLSPYTFKLNVEANHVSLSKVNELNILPPEVSKSMVGSVDFSIELKDDRTQKHLKTLKATVNLTDTALRNLPYNIYTKSAGVPLTSIVILRLVPHNNEFNVDQLTLSGKDIAAQIRVSVDKKIGSTNIVLDRFMIDKLADLTGYIYLSHTDLNANLKGPYLNVGKVIQALRSYTKNNQKDQRKADLENTHEQAPSKKISNYVVKLTVGSAVGNGVTIKDLYTNVALYNHNIYNLIVSGELGKDQNLTILFDKDRNSISYNVDHLEKLITFLGSHSAVRNGVLSGRVVFNQDDQDNIYTYGKATLKYFKLDVIPFANANIDFNSNNLFISITKLDLKGTAMAAHLKGYLNLNNNYLLLSGYLIPMWGANHFLVNIPLLGDFLSSKFTQNILSGSSSNKNIPDSKKGAVNVDFSIFGDITKKIDYKFETQDITPQKATPPAVPVVNDAKPPA